MNLQFKKNKLTDVNTFHADVPFLNKPPFQGVGKWNTGLCHNPKGARLITRLYLR